MKKIIFFIFLIYFLILLQTSFLIHFNIFFNFVLFLVILFNLFQEKENPLGLWLAGISGFFWDIFSTLNEESIEGLTGLIGFHTLLLLLVSIFIKKVIKKYVRLPITKKI